MFSSPAGRAAAVLVLIALANILLSPAVSQQKGSQAQTAQSQLAPTPQVQALLNSGASALAGTPRKPYEAERLFRLALDRAEALGDKKGKSKALLNLGN